MDNIEYAGFWRRLIALVIDYNIIVIALFPVFLCLGYMIPDQVVVNVPFDLFSNEAVLDSENEEIEHQNGSVTVIVKRTIKKETLVGWTYFYRETEQTLGNDTETNRVLIDPETLNAIDKMEDEDFIIPILLLYWILMESSQYKASLGKMAFGIQVTDGFGNRLSILRSLSRNVSKFLSAFTMCIGFMMAGWTSKKQSLHDMVSRTLVVVK